MSPTARERILAAAAEHGWTPRRNLTTYNVTLDRGTAWMFVQFSRTGSVTYASYNEASSGHEIGAPDRAGEVLGFLAQPAPAPQGHDMAAQIALSDEIIAEVIAEERAAEPPAIVVPPMVERQWTLLRMIADRAPAFDAFVPLDAAVRAALDRIAELETLARGLDVKRATLAARVAELEGLRTLGSEQCCELACNGGGCEICACCSAGWCVFGAGEFPERADDRAQWVEVAREHNPVAEALAVALARVAELEAAAHQADDQAYADDGERGAVARVGHEAVTEAGGYGVSVVDESEVPADEVAAETAAPAEVDRVSAGHGISTPAAIPKGT